LDTFGTAPIYEVSLSPEEKSVRLLILKIRVVAPISPILGNDIKIFSHASHKHN